ncbi:MAG: hypothetical protein GEEBNDBF_01938 [bacterium]|nr:hypothetical protein [bacterium]
MMTRPRAIPHLDIPGATQMITFRLLDALPPRQASSHHTTPSTTNQSVLWFRNYDSTLDAGHGACLLRMPWAAKVVQDCLLCEANTKYDLEAWVVMPNHVHLLVRPHEGVALRSLVQAWKSVTAHRINALLGRHGPVWQRDYFDRVVRTDRHHMMAREYIEMNPVRAGLVASPTQYRWSSAYHAVEIERL